ncbi:hypothetical protein D9M69_512410 [compost metagenome]
MTSSDDDQPSQDRQTATASELASVLGVHASTIARHKPDLPTPTTCASTGQPGRPADRYSIEALTDFALRRTAHLSEAQCRLLLAIAMCSQKRKAKPPKNATLVPDGTGEAFVVPAGVPFARKPE